MRNIKIVYCRRCGRFQGDLDKVILYRPDMFYVYYICNLQIELIECEQCWNKIHLISIYHIRNYIYDIKHRCNEHNGFFIISKEQIIGFLGLRVNSWSYLTIIVKLDDWNLVNFEEDIYDSVFYCCIYKKCNDILYLTSKLPVSDLFRNSIKNKS